MKPICAVLVAMLLAGCQVNIDPRTDLNIPLAGGESLMCVSDDLSCTWRIVRAEKRPLELLREHMMQQGFRHEP